MPVVRRQAARSCCATRNEVGSTLPADPGAPCAHEKIRMPICPCQHGAGGGRPYSDAPASSSHSRKSLALRRYFRPRERSSDSVVVGFRVFEAFAQVSESYASLRMSFQIVGEGAKRAE